MSVPAVARRIGAGSLAVHGRRFLRFGAVGIIGVAVNTLILFLLVTFAHLHHLAGAAIATEVAIISNFTLNDRWTFRASTHALGWGRRLVHYNLIALGGLGIQVGVLAVLTLGGGIYYLLANLIGIAAAMIWNYIANLRFTWRGHGARGGQHEARARPLPAGALPRGRGAPLEYGDD